jgi:hypothetical protein
MKCFKQYPTIVGIQTYINPQYLSTEHENAPLLSMVMSRTMDQTPHLLSAADTLIPRE